MWSISEQQSLEQNKAWLSGCDIAALIKMGITNVLKETLFQILKEWNQW